MSKFKKGDRVRVIDRRSPNYGCVLTIKDWSFGTLNFDTSGYPIEGSSILKNPQKNVFQEHQLERMEKTMDNLEIGDILVRDGRDYGRRVIGLLEDGKVVVTRDTDDEDVAANTLEDIRHECWKLQTEVKEMTVADIAKALGHEVKIVKE